MQIGLLRLSKKWRSGPHKETTIMSNCFRTFTHIYEYLLAHATRDGWPIYDAAIAAGLKGDREIAGRLFDQSRHGQRTAMTGSWR